MLRDYHYPADESAVRQLAGEQRWDAAFEQLAQPLHEALYKEQDFALMDRLSDYERLVLSFDYVQMQVGQGGFIQLIQNGYISLLVPVIESLQHLKLSPGMAIVLDDVLKVFVLNKEVLGRETSVEDFGRLYAEFKEFEVLEKQYEAVKGETVQEMVAYATTDEA